jgi:hypothetical protein
VQLQPVIFLGRKIAKKATTASKIWRKWPCFLKKNRQIETVLKFLGESVAPGLAVGDSFNGQIIKLSPFMSHFDFRFWPPLRHCRFEKKKTLGTCCSK